MKILFVIFGVEDSCRYIIDALEDHEIIYVLPHEKHILPTAARIFIEYSHENFHDILVKMPSDFIPDAVIIWGPEYTGIPLLIEECPYPIFGFIGDWNVNFSSIKDIIKSFDYSFVSDPKGVEVFQKYGYQAIEYMPIWGFSPNEHYKIDNTDKIYDVLFIGNLNNDLQKDRSFWLKRLAKLSNKYNIKILTGVHGYDYTLALNQAKITFNRSIKSELNMRIFEATECNSLLFYEEENFVIRDIFQDREHCVLYNDTNFEELIGYYLTHYQERERICNNAYVEVQKYTYKNQINKIIDRIKDIIPSLDISKREFKKLPELDKHNIRALQAMASLPYGAYYYSLSQLKKALNIDPENVLILNNMACILAQSNIDQSINILKKLLNNPINLNKLPLFNLANLCITADKKEEAIEYFEKLIAALENNSDEISLEGLFYTFKYDYFKVEWEKCHYNDINQEKDKRDLVLYDSYKKLGDLYYDFKNYTKSINALEKSVKYRKDSYLAYKELSVIYSLIKDYDKAIENLEQAIKNHPLDPDYWEDLVELYDIVNKNSRNFIEECLLILRAIPNLNNYISIFEKYKAKLQVNFHQPYKCFTMPHYDINQAIKEFNIKITDKVLDIGGGDAPFERADVVTELYLEDNTHRLGRAIRKDKKCYVECNVEELPFEDKEFDFVYCNHVLEHTDYPDKACNELMRVSKNGYLEVPSYWGEYLFGHTFHKWFIYWIDDTLIFKRKPYTQKDKFNTPFNGLVHYWWEIQHRMDFVKNWQIYYRNFWTIQILWKDKFNFKVIDDCEYDNDLESLLQDYNEFQYKNEILKFPLKNAFGNNYPSFDINNLIDIFNIKDTDKVLAIGDTDYLEQFRKLNNVTSFVVANEQLPFKDKEFDFVFVNDILVNTSNPVYLCDEIKRVAKRGFIELPNAWTEFIFKETNNQWYVENINNKLHFHSRKFVNSPFNEILYKEYLQNEILQKQYDVLYRNLTRIQYYWENSFDYTIATQPEEIKTDFSLSWAGAFYYPTGFGDEARNFVTAINSNFKTNIKIHNSLSVIYNIPVNINDYLTEDIKSLTNTQLKDPIVNIQHLLPELLQKDAKSVLNIGRTMFETDSLPKDLVDICNTMDEIWVPSDFNIHTFSESGVDCSKLFKIPGTIDLDLFDPDKTIPLDIPEIKDKFVFLSTFDFQPRKGWDILIKAFVEEFMGQNDVALLLKVFTFSSDMNSTVIKEKIYSGIEQYYDLSKIPRIEIMDDFISTKEYPRLYKSVDCYVMPSRGEGWGRPYMEAMTMELPVIGTRWSANLEFMTDENSFLIDCNLIDIRYDIPKFKGRKWADPDFNHLKKLLRYVYENYQEAKIKGKIARQDIKRKYSYNKISRLIMKRLNHSLSLIKPMEWNIYFDGNSANAINIEIFKAFASVENINFSWSNLMPDQTLPKSLIQYINKYLDSNDFKISSLSGMPDRMPQQGHWIIIPENLDLIDEFPVLGLAVDSIWVFNPYAKLELLKRGVNKDKLEYIPLGIPDFINTSPLIKNKKAKRSVNFLFIGELTWNSGIDILIKSYCDSFSDKDDVCLMIKDIKPYMPDRINIDDILNEIKKDKPNLPKIDIINNQEHEDIAELYRIADYFINPYRKEESFVWVLKAMSAQIPVLITDGIMNNGICSSETAYLLPAEKQYLISNKTMDLYYEPESLTPIFKQLMNKKTDFNKLQKAKEHVKANFSISKFYQKIKDSLSKIQLKPIERFKPDTIEKYFNNGIVLFKQNKFEEAEIEFEQALKLSNKDWTIMHSLLLTYLSQNKLDKFKPLLAQMVSLNEDTSFINEVFPLLDRSLREKLALYLPQRIFVCDQEFHDLLNLNDKRLIFTTRPSGKPYTRIWNIENLSGFPDKEAYSNIIRFMEGDEINNLNICMNADEIWVSNKNQRQKLIQSQYPKEAISYIPVLINPDIFNNQDLLDLAQKSKFNLLFIWDTNKPDINWQDLLTAYFDSFAPDQEITLFIKVQPQNKLQDIFAQIEQFAADKNYDLENIPDIVILEEDIAISQIPALLEAMDGLIIPKMTQVENYYTLLARYMSIPLINCYKDLEDLMQQLITLHRDKDEILRKNLALNYELLPKHNYKILNKYIIKKLLQNFLLM